MPTRAARHRAAAPLAGTRGPRPVPHPSADTAATRSAPGAAAKAGTRGKAAVPPTPAPRTPANPRRAGRFGIAAIPGAAVAGVARRAGGIRRAVAALLAATPTTAVPPVPADPPQGRSARSAAGAAAEAGTRGKAAFTRTHSRRTPAAARQAARVRAAVTPTPAPRTPANPRRAGRVRRVGAAVLVGAVAGVVVVGAAGAAQATGYRYWSYWLRSEGGGWTYAQSGPSMHVPKDGDVEGWRFAVSKDAADKAVQPRGAADFAAICAHTPPAAGDKRIALLIDPGTAADAPGGATPPAPRTACARVPGDASSADALAAVARPLRYDSSGILCAIAGYPAQGCGDQVASGPVKSVSGGAHAHGGGPSAGVWAGIAAVAAVAAAALWQSRRRNRA